MAIGATTWVIPEGFIPSWSNGPAPELTSHDVVCILNAGDDDAQVELTVYFTDREPAGPYRFSVPARRTGINASTTSRTRSRSPGRRPTPA